MNDSLTRSHYPMLLLTGARRPHKQQLGHDPIEPVGQLARQVKLLLDAPSLRTKSSAQKLSGKYSTMHPRPATPPAIRDSQRETLQPSPARFSSGTLTFPPLPQSRHGGIVPLSTTSRSEATSAQSSMVVTPLAGSSHTASSRTLQSHAEHWREGTNISAGVPTSMAGVYDLYEKYASKLKDIGLDSEALIRCMRGLVPESRKDKLEEELQRRGGLTVVEAMVLIS
ncbi:uncharacterized protein C8Q71DRAFT_403129 [Rhodofomes roseus]|uniref:Uncharacterized protein n=1 Tax=Rhodofomes roseus TaxID=34475 RepID=A0ABQ8K001_9APHY|nr:uncharacterized protein C8Q71DRAFT_403129 [Rhodofomes roseus]KAH9829422.1 hypothetical protein C8Q71DRAFT_403129 [Rhodofomes roseus]